MDEKIFKIAEKQLQFNKNAKCYVNFDHRCSCKTISGFAVSCIKWLMIKK